MAREIVPGRYCSGERIEYFECCAKIRIFQVIV